MKDWVWATAIFVLICIFGAGARGAIGTIYSAGEAVVLLEALSRSGLYLGSAVATASATTLALMLTLIGLVRRSDADFNTNVYKNIDRVAVLSTASLISSVLLLLILVFPIGEFDDIPDRWYPSLYEGLFAAVVIVAGLLAATITMLYRTIREVISKVTPGDSV